MVGKVIYLCVSGRFITLFLVSLPLCVTGEIYLIFIFGKVTCLPDMLVLGSLSVCDLVSLPVCDLVNLPVCDGGGGNQL